MQYGCTFRFPPSLTPIRNWSLASSFLHVTSLFIAAAKSKQQQTSDWGAPDLNDAQRDYAASDVRYLHRLKERLDVRLARESRTELAQACFDFLPARALLDLAGWAETDIFAHG